MENKEELQLTLEGLNCANCARKIEEKYQSGQAVSASWKVEENRIIKE